MNPFSSNDQQFLHQITSLFLLAVEGEISDEQFRQLNQLLIKNPAARDYYYDFVASYVSIKSLEMFAETDSCRVEYLNQFMAELAEAESNSPSILLPRVEEKEDPVQLSRPVPEARKISKLSWVSLILSAAAVLLIALFVRFVPVEPQRSLVARLVNAVDARWEHVSGDLSIGCNLHNGPMKLASGFAEIEMDSGANVIIEGPAQFMLESSTQLYLQQGRLVVKVSDQDPEHPFVVRSPQTSIVDYGTEFGVQVDPADKTLTHVYEGKVELRSGSNPLRFEHSLLLTRDQGGQADAQGRLSPGQGFDDLFVRKPEFDTKVKAVAGSAYHRWLAYSYRLRRDPDLVAYYTFEEADENPLVLTNNANTTHGTLDGILRSDGNAMPPAWQTGRWAQKTALSFNRSQQQCVAVARHPALDINGPITIAAWVYCSGDRDGGHIVSNRVGVRAQSNYQFGYRSPVMPEWKKGMHLARKSDSGDSSNQVCSKTLPDPSGWILIAATHDNETLKFYLNGELVETKYWPHKLELVEGGVMIGSDHSPDDPSRFNGKIGEIVIAKRIFTESEIEQMYEAGKP